MEQRKLKLASCPALGYYSVSGWTWAKTVLRLCAGLSDKGYEVKLGHVDVPALTCKYLTLTRLTSYKDIDGMYND
jgi:hypothetical protein